MPVVFIHGVAVRDEGAWSPIQRFLKSYIADELNPDDPEKVELIPVYWGDVGAQFAWNRRSRPLSRLLGMGGPGSQAEMTTAGRAEMLAAMSEALTGLPADPRPSGRPSGLIPAGPSAAPTVTAASVRLKDLTPEQLSDIAVAALQAKQAPASQHALAAIAADEVAHEPTTATQLAACPNLAAELELLQQRVSERYQEYETREIGLIGMGPGWFQDLKDRVGEALSRAEGSPGFAISTVVGELRRPLNDFVTLFIGDVLTYLTQRQDASSPGEIPQRLLDGLAQARRSQMQRDNEPIVVISHSMGGQIVYDAVTSFLPRIDSYQDIRIDFWCATASQVGLFEELKLFLASDPRYDHTSGRKVPFPDRRYLGIWWNLWDSNDFISYTAHPIFEGVDDQQYDSGMSLLGAHSGYLQRPSFYRALAARLRAARERNWNRP